MRGVASILFLLFAYTAHCQVGDIISGIGDLSGASGCGESCGDACADGCLTGVYLNCGHLVFSTGLFEGISRAQREFLAKKEDIRRIVSLDVFYHYGLTWDLTDTSFAPLYNSILNIPGLRFNWGLFGLEYRFDRFADKTGWLHNNDAVVHFNLAQQDKINYRISSGFSLLEGFNEKNKRYVSQFYGLMAMGVDLFLWHDRFCPSLEARLSSNGSAIQRVEAFPKLGIRLYGSKHLALIADLGYNFRRYNQSQNSHTLMAGVRVNIR